MSLTPDPYLMRVRGTDIADSRAVIVGGDFEQIDRHAKDLAADADAESKPVPHPAASFINWLIVCGCAIALAVVSVPELRAAVAAFF